MAKKKKKRGINNKKCAKNETTEERRIRNDKAFLSNGWRKKDINSDSWQRTESKIYCKYLADWEKAVYLDMIEGIEGNNKKSANN